MLLDTQLTRRTASTPCADRTTVMSPRKAPSGSSWSGRAMTRTFVGFHGLVDGPRRNNRSRRFSSKTRGTFNLSSLGAVSVPRHEHDEPLGVRDALAARRDPRLEGPPEDDVTRITRRRTRSVTRGGA